MRCDRRRSRQAGFLLPETLATFAISAFVLAALASITPVLMRAVDVSVARIQDGEGLGRTLAALTRDISGLERMRWSGLEPQSFVFRGGPNSLYFAHRVRGKAGLFDMHVVALREIVAGSGTQLVRSEALLPPSARSFADLRFVDARPLDTGSTRLRFAYVAERKGSTPSPPAATWPSDALLPEAIVMEAIDPGTRQVILSTQVPIHANADIGCLARSDASAPVAPDAVPGAASGPPPPGTAPPGASPVAPLQPPPPVVGADDAFCGRLDAKEAGAAPPPPANPL